MGDPLFKLYEALGGGGLALMVVILVWMSILTILAAIHARDDINHHKWTGKNMEEVKSGQAKHEGECGQKWIDQVIANTNGKRADDAILDACNDIKNDIKEIRTDLKDSRDRGIRLEARLRDENSRGG